MTGRERCDEILRLIDSVLGGHEGDAPERREAPASARTRPGRPPAAA